MSSHNQATTPRRSVRFAAPGDKENASSSHPRTPLQMSITKTPQYSASKLLRKRFHDLNMSSSTPRRLMESGAVRVDAYSKPSERIGYDGTTQTPSKQLLRSTAASRAQQIHPRLDSDPVATMLHQQSSPANATSPTRPCQSVSPPTIDDEPPTIGLLRSQQLIRPKATKQYPFEHTI
jgi:hypothetical protein